MLEVVISVRLE